MLLKIEDIMGELRSPVELKELKIDKDRLLSNGREFKIINGFPILVDFSLSVIDENSIKDLSSVVERVKYRGFLNILKQLVSTPHDITKRNVDKILKLYSKNSSIKVLIIGGGTIGSGMEPFYKESNIELISFDIYASDNVQFIADAHNIPIRDNYFDIVIIQAILEHVLNPQKVVDEIYRVLKESGVVYSETPFMQQVHEGAYDFTRFTESGHRYLYKRFELIDSGATAGVGTQLLWSIDYFFRSIFRAKVAGKIAKILFFWLKYFDKLTTKEYNIDGANGTYFLGKKTDIVLTPKDIITHYKGAQK